ncbi:hypothetical protein ON010_g8401 [Phytophthora cinnamomi]|nr:hypothetical protein ON010_g8401 [Phytophthora cinnamomi]
MILPPFIVMPATHNGTLARRFATWRDEGGDASIHFQPSHWMDIPTAKKYIDFLISPFPNKKVGLIWDAASAHICEEIIEYMSETGLVYEFIPAGLTSIMQICDLYANHPLKAAIKKKFLQWKISKRIPPGGKYQVDRMQVIHWVEEAVSAMNETQSSDGKIEYMFNKLGQDLRTPNNERYQGHLSQLQESVVYSSLLQNQPAESLE